MFVSGDGKDKAYVWRIVEAEAPPQAEEEKKGTQEDVAMVSKEEGKEVEPAAGGEKPMVEQEETKEEEAGPLFEA